MAKLGVSLSPFNENNWQRFQDAARRAVETHDFDSGWILTPADKVIRHKLGVLPKTVLVYASDNANGKPMSSDGFTYCDDQSVKITGPKAYCRVLVNA